MLRLCLLPFVSLALLAQDPSPVLSPTPTAPAQILVSAPFHGVWIDDAPASDGRLWCRADRYKMSFGADGASYVPLLGWRAPRNFPLSFHLAGTAPAAPERRGDGFVYRHPAMQERWDLRPEGAEQSFELQDRPAGDVLRVEVATLLQFTGADGKGLHFAAEGWGEVVYGNAVAIQPDGLRLDLHTTFAAGSICIELPAGASYPLVVDPFVTTIGVASNEVADNRNPDVAYDAASDIWCVAMEERVSALDTDIKVRRYTGAGVLLDTDFFESSGTIADLPAVASAGNSQQQNGPGTFCVVWRERSADIVARRCGATAASPVGPVTLYQALLVVTDHAQRPDIAGSRSGNFIVVYVVESSITPPMIMCAKFSQVVGSPQTVLLATTTGCITPHVADALPPNEHWAIAWNHQVANCLGGDVHLAVVNQQLGVELPPTVVAGAIVDDDRHVDVAWNGSVGLVVWDRDQGSHHDIFGQAFERTPSGYSLLGGNRNLTALEPGITLTADQQKPVIATDGTRFVVAYMEGSTQKPVCATFAVNGSVIECHEGHVPIATANLDHDDMGIAAMGSSGGALTRYFVVTDERDGLNDYDVQGLFYDGRQTGAFFTTIGTGCAPIAAVQPQLTATGSSDLGHSFTLTMSGHRALPFVLAGAPLSPTQLLCTFQIIRQCRQGVQMPLLLSSFGPSLQVSVPPSVGLVGMTVAFQGIDVLANGACGTNLFGAAFSVTDTIQATIR